ncbi:hypothetical protein M445_05510 [Vibrio owensii 47666-1]|uniref:tight adherence pilus pseudopilin TadF n=1 Tax=Vibrio owensii TaxID=696485 RepID=UPI000585668E|nr:tight adherence pilus pseudopilin TadF [Vibrio owensii]KIF48798.1 hypothetical protein M445_05510 [Vibrio owensii 47666-1]
MTNLKSRQKGTFAIEFAIVALVFAAVITFSMDVAIKLSIRGKIDRLSHSLVNVIRERTQLYEGVEDVSSADANEMWKIAVNSLKDSVPNFDETKLGMNVDWAYSDGVQRMYSVPLGLKCGVAHQLVADFDKHTVAKEDGSKHPIYNINICYQISNVFSVGKFGKYTMVESESWAVGR